MPRVGSTFYSQIGKMAVSVVVRRIVDGMKYSRIRAVGYTFYSQNTLLAVLIEANGCKKCSHISRSKIKWTKVFHDLPFYVWLFLNMSLEICVAIFFCHF